MNPKDESGAIIELELLLSNWRFHPTDNSIDVAVIEQGIPSNADQLVLPLSLGADREKFDKNDIDLGDEVFISGLFVHHYGKHRNIQIVRVGNLAALNEEKVGTKRGLIDAYLIEARSIGGLSGSPVFLNLGTSRLIEGALKFHSDGPMCFLLGLIHGHFDVTAGDTLVDGSMEDAARESVNSGIAIVVPFEKIWEVVDHAMRAGISYAPKTSALSNFNASNIS
jgi:hypothetical protein